MVGSMVYLILLFAIISEVFGDSMMKLSEGFSKKLPLLGVIAGYGLSFYLLANVLKHIGLGIAYALWTGVGITLTMIVGILCFKERINQKKLLGLVLIVIGVVLIRLGAPSHV